MYKEYVMKIASYLSIGGLFEIRDGLTFSMFNNINEHSFDWKYYGQNIETNGHNLLELKFNVSDAVLLGSSDSVDSIPEVTSKYQLQFNEKKLYQDAYNQCRLNSVCS